MIEKTFIWAMEADVMACSNPIMYHIGAFMDMSTSDDSEKKQDARQEDAWMLAGLQFM